MSLGALRRNALRRHLGDLLSRLGRHLDLSLGGSSADDSAQSSEIAMRYRSHKREEGLI